MHVSHEERISSPLLNRQANTYPQEARASARIGVPLALGELGWMSTYIVDAIMIGRLPHSALPIAASSLGNTIYYALVFFVIYLLNGLETFIAQAAGRGNRSECVVMLMQSMWIVLVGTPLVMVATMGSALLLPHFGTPADIVQSTHVYLRALIWSTPPLMLYMALRRYLQSINRVMLISVSLITASGVNWLFDWLFLFGHWHFPAMGIAGSGWSTVVVRFWMLAILLAASAHSFRQLNLWPRWSMLRPDPAKLGGLLRIGWPSGLEFFLELGISTFMSILCARLGTTLLAAHQVTLDLNAFIYMVPAGMSYAAMIRVGQAAGRNSLRQVKLSANTPLGLSLGYSCVASAVFLLFAHRLASVYTNDPQVVAAAVPLFHLCSIIIFADAAFVVLASALTGLGDTRTPMWVSIVCNWCIGMPVAYWLAFPLGFGLHGLWWGRTVASVTSGSVLTFLWYARIRREHRAEGTHTLQLRSPLDARSGSFEPA
jgi:MATE family multidrug resistance protein